MSQMLPKQSTGVQWWVLLVIIGGSVAIATGSCLAATWRWRVYRKQHQQDADLIRTLLERNAAALMSLREQKKATDNFSPSAQIREGGFGTVYIGKLNDGTMVAIKNKVAVLVFELVSDARLKDHLQSKFVASPLSWKQRLHVAIQTADALDYLHSAATFPIIHRDVTLANILLNENLDADFGISKLAPVHATHV